MLETTDQQMRAAAQLRWGSTWKLVGLTFITLGLYTGFFAVDQGRSLNSILPSNRKISDRLLLLVLNLQIAAVALFFPYIFFPEGHWIEPISDAVDLAAGVALIVWGFSMRSRINDVLGDESGFFVTGSGFLTFFLSPMYFNYKINQYCSTRSIHSA